MASPGFPSLEPAFTARLYPNDEYEIGVISNGESLTVVPIASGTIVSEPGSGTYLDAEMVHGSDYVTMQPSQTHTRINVRAILRDKDGALLTYSYKGIIEIDEAFLAILTGSPDAKTTSYGKALSQIKFGTGSERHKDLENGLFVGSAHFVVENGKYFVETKISRIVG